MNHSWKKFLLDAHASFENDNQIVFPSNGIEGHKRIYPISNLAVLTVAGKDAAKFLQGQVTCNVDDITETLSGFGAFCTPKGRVITTFLLSKSKDVYFLIMPDQLLATVKKRLQMYILRSDVTLTDGSEDLCLIGLWDSDKQTGTSAASEPLFTASTQEDALVCISLPQNRYLIIAEPLNAIALWSNLVSSGQHFIPDNSAQWRHLDIISGIPWLTIETSEEFIPQMLNIDKLGGISFNKGCYTGQEIVARTHYLGKSKREMFLAECVTANSPEPNTPLFDDNVGEEEIVGRVLQAQNQQDICKMLIVLQIAETKTYNLKLKSDNRNKITVLTL
jgi:folate-binding protein YgfZ